MPVSPSSRRWLFLAGVGVYWVVLFVLTHLPLDPERQSQAGKFHLDKLAHAAAFCGLAVLVSAAIAANRPLTWPMRLAIVGLLAAYAAVDELTQGLIRHRVPDVSDWLADMIGVGAGLVAFAWARHFVLRRTQPTSVNKPAIS